MVFSKSSFSSFISWMALSRSPSRLCKRRTSVSRPLPISNANSGWTESYKGDTVADDREHRTDRHHPHDEQRSLHGEIGLQQKDQLWSVPNLEVYQPFLVTPVTECRSSWATTRPVYFSPRSKNEHEREHAFGPNDWVSWVLSTSQALTISVNSLYRSRISESRSWLLPSSVSSL